MKKDRRSLNVKRSQYARIYENGDLLLNPFVAQCPLCGSLVALGQMNSVNHKFCHMMDHVATHAKHPTTKPVRGKWL